MWVALIGNAAKESQIAREVGFYLARAGHVVLTGACGGTPGDCETAALEAGGAVIGFSPAENEKEHVALGLPARGTRETVYTGRGFKGRNVDMIMASNAVVMIGGRLGTLHEAITAIEEGRPLLVFWATGGAATVIWFIVHLLRPEHLKILTLCRKVRDIADRLPKA